MHSEEYIQTLKLSIGIAERDLARAKRKLADVMIENYKEKTGLEVGDTASPTKRLLMRGLRTKLVHTST